MRDTFYNTLAVLAIATFVALAFYTMLTIGALGHPANNCREDETWAPVHHTTQGATQDSRGITRLCVNIEEL